ncbi:restriction endonuclease subunit S, partial [Escherichia coli]|nr:restriction endonuclease subunit S [Escherichia coli]MHQ23461.1 restriction endonuclease subunit S [Escherichia coli]
MVPKGWSHTTFEKHIDCLTGYAFSSTEYSAEEHDIRLLRGDNIEPGKLRWINAKRWPRNVQENMDKYFLLEGDFVIALDRTWISGGLKVAEVTCDDLPCLLVQRVARIRAKKTLAQGLLRQYFSGYKFERYVKLTQTATAVPHISPNDIKQFSLLLPPIAEQKKIAQILSTWDKAISVTEKLLANSQQQKKALMQQLLTGKKRLLDENGV